MKIGAREVVSYKFMKKYFDSNTSMAFHGQYVSPTLM